MTKTDAAEATSLTNTASHAVERVEAITLGTPWADAITAAETAVQALMDQATAEVFPATVQPIGADLMCDFEAISEDIQIARAHHVLAELHGLALDTHPALAQMLRGRVVRTRLLAFAARAPDGEEGAGEFLSTFQQTAAEQLTARGELLPWSDHGRHRAQHEEHDRREAREADEQAHRERVGGLLRILREVRGNLLHADHSVGGGDPRRDDDRLAEGQPE